MALVVDEPAATEIRSTIEYRDIPGFPGYRIGNDGSLLSCRGIFGRAAKDGRWKRLSPGKNQHGYFAARLSAPDGTRPMMFIHRLVLMAFVGPRPEGMICRHLNGNKTDNRPENLAWGTSQENGDDQRRLGECPRGQDHHGAKLSDDDVIDIRNRYSTGIVTQAQLAKEYGVHVPMICRIVRRQNWKHMP